MNALAWDGLQGVLYIGGYFDAVGNRTIPAGLAMWSVEEGLMPFSGGGIFAGGDSGVAQALVFDAESKVRALIFVVKNQQLIHVKI